MMQEYPVAERPGEETIHRVESKIKIPIFSNSKSDDKTPLIDTKTDSSRLSDADLTYITATATPEVHQK